MDTHASQAWNAEQTDVREQEDEQLNDLWTEIDDRQKQRLWGLSSDLNTLRDRETWIESDWPPMTTEELGRAQRDAFQRQNWDEFLELLRQPPRFLSRYMVDYLRGRAWMKMGHPEAALLFFDNATRLEPGNATYSVLALECLKAMQYWPELLRRSEAYLHGPATPSRLLFRAADALHMYANQTGEQQYYCEAIQAVEKGFGRLNQADQQEPLSSVLAGAYAVKALCLEHLGRVQESLQVFDHAVQRFPENTALLTARGLLKQQFDIPDAMDDFRHAINRGTAVVWPYIELARAALHEGENAEVVDLCRRGLAVAQRDRVAATLFQLLAIALLRLHDSFDAVRAAFRTAGDLDPLSEEIRYNCDQFEVFAAMPAAGEPEWTVESKAPGAAMGEVYAQLQAAT